MKNILSSSVHQQTDRISFSTIRHGRQLCLSFFLISSILQLMDEAEVKSMVPLLDKNGIPLKDKWARHPYFAYSRRNLKCFPLSLWQWNGCTVINSRKEYMLSLFFSDLGSCGFFQISYADLKKGSCTSVSSRKCFTIYRTGLMDASGENESATYLDSDNLMTLSMIKKDLDRYIIFNAPFLTLPDGSRGLLGDFSLSQTLEKESLCTVSGWAGNDRKFRLCEMIPALEVSGGFIRKNGKKDNLAEDNALAILEWQRGVWNRKSSITQAFASSATDEGTVSLTFGFGEHDNAVYINDRLYNTGRVTMNGNIIRDEKGCMDIHFTRIAGHEDRYRGPGVSLRRRQDYGVFDGNMIIEGKEIKVPSLPGVLCTTVTP